MLIADDSTNTATLLAAIGSLVVAVGTCVGTFVLNYLDKRKEKKKEEAQAIIAAKEAQAKLEKQQAEVEQEHTTADIDNQNKIIKQWQEHLKWVTTEHSKAIKEIKDQNQEQQREINRLLKAEQNCRIYMAKVIATIRSQGIKIDLPEEPS